MISKRNKKVLTYWLRSYVLEDSEAKNRELRNVLQGYESQIDLDIGGIFYSTTISTLTAEPDSMLSSMFSGRFPIKKNDKGKVFIDRDGSVFGYILDYLRDGQFEIPKDEIVFNKLVREVKFYGIRGMEVVLDPTIVETENDNAKIPQIMQLPTLPSTLYAIGGAVGTKEKSKKVLQYDIDTKTWSQAPSLLKARCNHATASLGSRVFAVGGSGTPRLCEMYDPHKQEWTSISTLKHDRVYAQLIEAGDKLYAIGGRDVDTMEYYDPGQCTWNLMQARLTFVNSYFEATEWNGSIVFSGGKRGTVEQYDPRIGRWSYLGQSETITSHQLVSLGDKIYSLGGWTNKAQKTVKCFDMKMQAWSTVASMSTARQAHRAARHNGKIVVLGGIELATMEEYSPELDQWTMLPDMHDKRHSFGVAVL